MQGQQLDVAELNQTVRAVLARHLDIAPGELTGDLVLQDHGLDDDRAIAVLGDVGHELDVRFPDDFFDGLDTCDQFTSAVRIAIGA